VKKHIIFLVFLISNAISWADIYQIPLDVDGYYEIFQVVDFNIDLGTELIQIHNVRFNCIGDISAIDAPGLFECTFFAGTAKWQHAYTDVIFSPSFTPFTCNNIPFVSSNDATWDFLLDGNASGYVGLITSAMFFPENPPDEIYGHIYSASLTIDATPVPEPATLLLLALGAFALKRNHRHHDGRINQK
jgi:hypothetical protein